MNYRKAVLLLAAIPVLAVPLIAQHNERHEGPEREFRADLRGRNEVPLTLSAARGTLALTVNDADTSVHFVLEYSGLQTTVAASHIHVGQPNVNGGEELSRERLREPQPHKNVRRPPLCARPAQPCDARERSSRSASQRPLPDRIVGRRDAIRRTLRRERPS